MLLSRCRTVICSIGRCTRSPSRAFATTPGRYHVWHYREPHPGHPKSLHFMANALGVFLWYWILFHCWYDYEHLVGHFSYPNPDNWTDEELGIPPDDEEL